MKKTFPLYLSFFALCFILGFSMSTQAQVTWEGGYSQNWHDEQNWKPELPGPGDDVIIPANSGTIYYYPNSTVESVEIGSNSHLIIDEDATLNADDDHYFGFKVFGTLENHGSIAATSVNFDGINVRTGGTVNNYGSVIVKEMYRRGILVLGSFNNFQRGEVQILDAQDRAIVLIGGSFTNAGFLQLNGKQIGDGISVSNSSTFDNQKTGEIYFHEDYAGHLNIQSSSLFINDGLLQIESNVTSVAAIYLNSGTFENKSYGNINMAIRSGYDGVFVGPNSSMENEGEIDIAKYGSGYANGIRMTGGDFHNKAGALVEVSYVNVGLLIGTDRTFTNDGELKIKRCSIYGINNYGTYHNSSDLLLDRCTGIRNQSGATVLNARGTIRTLGAYYYSFQNYGTFTNEPCSNIHVEGRILNSSGGFYNYGYMDCTVDGPNFFGGDDLNNYGIILDTYERFTPILNNEVIRFSMLDDRPNDWAFEDVLDLGIWGDYSMDMYWYHSMPFTYQNEAGFYDEYDNSFYLWGDEEGVEATFYYVVLTHTPTGCVTVVEVPIDPAVQVQSFGNGPSDKLSSDRAANPMEEKTELQLEVFPNPSNGQFQIQLDQPFPGSATLRLLDATGRTAWTQKTDKVSNLSLDLTNEVTPGIYYLQVIQPGQAPTTKRLVIQPD